MSRRDEWDYEDDGEHARGRSTQRDYMNKYRHKIYDFDEDDDITSEEYYAENSVVYDDDDDYEER